ncbi:DUF6438 domain-containing protein [Aurantiacibacter sp. D1-12]|uniref:DUF6438 domain-containing protein n=1 Tax=Aurantiacibacter sp. D1-12 TaxID=2993658 RepID=UPI00237D2FD9|nr:DUF6438 domain-containing protein [Aurantiacibacter sp. D1-12]MDE1466719.1 DUF6438 domain-containing protein [Aurantiacibacter sp. D1-12]
MSPILIAFALSACMQDGAVTEPASDAPATSETPIASGERIAFSLEPCFGFCPDFELEIDGSGRGTYDGQNFVLQRGRHDFSASAEEVAAFAERLAPFRPAQDTSYGYDNCDVPVYTDAPSVRITWFGEDGNRTELNWYLGCRQPGLVEHEGTITEAWEELPIGHLVGSDEDRASYRDR